jgi:branched-chain amino acid transport system substrate-binding protein
MKTLQRALQKVSASISLSLLLTAYGLPAHSQSAAGKAPLQVGIVIEQTGPFSTLGIPELQAIQLAVEEFNASGGADGQPVELLIKDTQSQPTGAAAAARAFANQVPAVIGSATGGSCRAMQPILSSANVLQYCLSPQDFNVTPLFFYGLATVAEYPRAIVPWLDSLKIRTIGILAQDDATGDNCREIFESIVKMDPRFKIVADQKFASGATNVEVQLTIIRDAKPDLVVSGTSGANLSSVAKGVKALGMQQPVYVANGSANYTSLDLVKTDIPGGGLFANAFWINVPSDLPSSLGYGNLVRQFFDAYQKTYGQPPSQLEAAAYDAATQVMTALKGGARTGTSIAAYLEEHSLTGVLGPYTLTKTRHQGASIPPIMMSFTADGKFKLAYNSMN